MEKDRTVTDFIDRLGLAADLTKAQLVDYWDADLCAIGIKRDARLVYVSTVHGHNNYYYELELLNEEDVSDYTVLQRGESVSENALVAIIKEFLHL